MGFRHCWAHVCRTEYGAPAGLRGKIISGESLVEESVVSIRVHNFSPTLKNRHLYESSLHSIIHINVPINSISPTPSTISHSLHSSYLTVGESVAINIWVFFPKIHHLISHKHINTKTFHQSITTYSSPPWWHDGRVTQLSKIWLLRFLDGARERGRELMGVWHAAPPTN